MTKMERYKRGQLNKPPESSSEVKVNVKTEDKIEISEYLGDDNDNEEKIPVDSNSSSEEMSEAEPEQEEIHFQPSTSQFKVVKLPVHKLDFTLKMQRQVRLVMGECIQVLKKDPREYHHFYLTVHKWIQVGLKQGHISDCRVDLIWDKCDGLAASEFQKSTAATSTCKLGHSQSHSKYLQYILNQNKDKSGCRPKSTLYRRIRLVQARWKEYIINDPLSFQDMRSNLKARLKLFEYSKNLTTPSSCAQMNILWSRVLSSQLFTSTQKYQPRSKTRRISSHEENRSTENDRVETPEERQERLKGKSNYYRLQRAAETPEERQERSKRQSNYCRLQLAAETPEQRQRRLKKLAENTKLWTERKLRNETPDQKEERLFRQRVYVAKKTLKKKMKQEGNFNEEEYLQKSEEIVEKYKRFKAFKGRSKFKRDKESRKFIETPEHKLESYKIDQEERKLRKNAMAKRRIAAETPEQRQARQNRQKLVRERYTMNLKNFETPEQRENRLAKDRIRKRLQKKKKQKGLSQLEFVTLFENVLEQSKAKEKTLSNGAIEDEDECNLFLDSANTVTTNQGKIRDLIGAEAGGEIKVNFEGIPSSVKCEFILPDIL